MPLPPPTTPDHETDRIDYAAEFAGDLPVRLRWLADRIEALGVIVRQAGRDDRETAISGLCDVLQDVEQAIRDGWRLLRGSLGRRDGP